MNAPAYEVKLENFEGPLDLLLHLLHKNEMDIYDIPMAEITAQYLAALDAMKSLNLDIAGEFLVMASKLIHIKSRLLLPQIVEAEPEEDEEDPRAELVRRLLEYQRYKEAAEVLDSFPVLGRDIYARTFPAPELDCQEDQEIQSVGLYELAEALRALLKDAPEDPVHEVDAERLSVADRINGILGQLESCRGEVSFRELIGLHPTRSDIVVTFLSMLELVRLRLVRLNQTERCGPIWLHLAGSALDQCPGSLAVDEANLGYS